MIFSKRTKIVGAFAMSLFISNVPSTVMAEGMVSTSSVVAGLTRSEAQSNIEDLLQRDDVKAELAKRGVSADEISSRLASLSAEEMRQLSGQINEARAGGDILITILVVVLIIFLIKRI